ncbi:MAG: hypothetical protein KTR25_17780 [Myxococcales bacterium]|nr:hypothetical protein [Myxococcales bacterium]
MMFGLLGAAKPRTDRPLRRIDRMWLAGAPALDSGPKAGIYVWLEKKSFHFGVAPNPKKPKRVYQWTVSSSEMVRLVPGGDCKVAARSARGLVLAAMPAAGIAQCVVKTKGEIKISRAKAGARITNVYVGPSAMQAAASVRIGRY